MQIYLFNALKILNGCCCRHYIVIGFPVQINLFKQQQQQQQHSLFSQASWGRLEMKPERNKFKVQAH